MEFLLDREPLGPAAVALPEFTLFHVKRIHGVGHDMRLKKVG